MRKFVKDLILNNTGAIRKLWGHRLMIWGLVIIFFDLLNEMKIDDTVIYSFGDTDIFQYALYVIGMGATLLGVGNITDIWKVKYEDEPNTIKK